jgi:hypothetical protein
MKSADLLAGVSSGLQIETLRNPFLRHTGLFGDGPRDRTSTPVSPAILSQLLPGEAEMLRSLREDFFRPSPSVGVRGGPWGSVGVRGGPWGSVIFRRSLAATPVVPALALAHLLDPGNEPLPESLRAPEPATLELFG